MINYKKTILKVLGIIALSLVILLSIALAVFFWPFLVAVVIAIILEKLVEGIVRKTKLHRKLVGTVLVILLYATLAFLIYLLISKLITEALSINNNLPQISEYIKTTYQQLYNKYMGMLDHIPNAVSSQIYDFGINFLGKTSEFAGKFFSSTIDFIIFIPSMFIYVIITFLATLFLVTDRRQITRYIYDIMPKKVVKKISNIFHETISSLSQYLKAQLIMICITFVELLIALFILKREYPFTLAIAIAAIDALPILGTGTVIIPWAIYSAVSGNMQLAVGLLITYIVIIVVRQLVEPRVVSKNIGVHPFITLISMYIGFKIFGLVGLIIGPIVMVIFKNVFTQLLEHGYLKNIIVYDKEEK